MDKSKEIPESEVKARIVKHSCGGVVFITVIDPVTGEIRNSAKKELLEYTDGSHTFEDVPVSEAREATWCDCK